MINRSNFPNVFLAFGCATEDYQSPNGETILDLSNANFGFSDSQYAGQLVCKPGYLMSDMQDSKATYCRSSSIEATARRRWEWDVPTELTTCNSKCRLIFAEKRGTG